MYAIFEAKGKQWRAEPGDTLRLPSLDAEPGDRMVFDQVLLADRDGEILVGRPVLGNASVTAEVVRHGKGEKVVVFKYKRRKGYRRKQGHRQKFTEVKILELDLDGAAPAAERPAAEPEAAAEAAEAVAEVDITDAARELAEEHGIDVTALEGTGKGGRILKSDVQRALDAADEETAVEEAGAEATDADEAEPEAEPAEPPAEVDITDAARELAEEHGIDVTALEGTGKDGRILKSDVQAALDEQNGE